MRFEDIVLENLDLDTGTRKADGVFCIPATNELVELINKIRERQGNTDLVSINHNNNVYYEFYLYFDAEETYQIKLQAVCNYGKKDDRVWYEIDLLPEEKTMLMFKVIKELVNELN